MKLFDYRDVAFLVKYSKEIFIGCIVITAIVFLIMVIKFFKRDILSDTIGDKILHLVITVLLVGGLGLVTWGVHKYTNSAGEIYASYNEAYENNQVKTVKGKVEDFTPATSSKSFTIEGVRFTIYEINSVVKANEAVLYYTYTNGSYEYSHLMENLIYKPGQCVILGDNQQLEVQYIEENGEKHILYIAELSN